MKDFLFYIISLLVDYSQEVNIEEKPIENNMYQYLISVNKEDMGKVIGKEGKIIQAIRNVAKIIAVKESKQIRIELV